MNSNTAYLQAFAEHGRIDNFEGMFEKERIDFRFDYGNVTYEEFREKPASSNWHGRKVVAIPKAIYYLIKAARSLLCYLALSTYNLCMWRKLNSGKTFYACLSVRDLQESLAHIVSLVNNQYALFLLERNQFSKLCDSYPSEIIIRSYVERVGLNSIDYKILDGEAISTIFSIYRDRLKELTLENFQVAFDKLDKRNKFDDYSFLTEDQVKYCFPAFEDSTADRLEKLTTESLQAVLKKIDKHVLKNFPNSRLKDLHDLDPTKDQLEIILTSFKYPKENKLALLTPESRQAVLAKLDGC